MILFLEETAMIHALVMSRTEPFDAWAHHIASRHLNLQSGVDYKYK